MFVMFQPGPDGPLLIGRVQQQIIYQISAMSGYKASGESGSRAWSSKRSEQGDAQTHRS